MNKKLILLAIIGAVIGAAIAFFRSPQRQIAKVQEMFPPEKLQGYAEGTQVRIFNRKSTGVSGGPVLALAIAPFGLAPAQIPPTGWGAIKALHEQYPDKPWL